MKYSQKLADKIIELVASGEQKIQDICTHVGISKKTFYEWKNENKGNFGDRLKEIESERLDNLGDLALSGLAILLTKHEYEEVTTEYIESKDGKPKIKSQKKAKKFIMPNPAAVIFALKNRDAENWKDKQELEHSGNITAEQAYRLPDGTVINF